MSKQNWKIQFRNLGTSFCKKKSNNSIFRKERKTKNLMNEWKINGKKAKFQIPKKIESKNRIWVFVFIGTWILSSSSLTTNQETRLIDWSNRLIWKNYEIEIDWFFSNETTKKTQNSKSEFLVHVFCKINWIPVFGFYLKFIHYLIIIIIICFSRFQGFSNQHHSVMTFFWFLHSE